MKKEQRTPHRKQQKLLLTTQDNKTHNLCDGTISTRWQCFITVTTSSPEFDSCPVSEPLSVHRRRAVTGIQRYASTRNSLPFHICALSLSLLSAQSAPMFVSRSCLTKQVPLAQTWCNYWQLFFFFFLISLFVTLYSWTTPFCSSSGGGCQETTMTVALSPLSVTVTLRGGALGADLKRQRKKEQNIW